MAGHLPKTLENFSKVPGAKVAIIGSSWHREIIDEMIRSCESSLLSIEVKKEDIEIHFAPGSHEIPLYAKLLLEKKPDLDGVITFGVVLKGGTTHNDSVLQAVVNGFLQLSLEYSKPIINEVIGVDKLIDAKERATDKGLEAAFAFSEAIAFKRSLLLL